MILTVIIVAVLAISCNNPSSLAKDYEKALKNNDFEKAAKVIEKAAEKYANWSSQKKFEFLTAVDEANNQFYKFSSPEAYEIFDEVLQEPMRKLFFAGRNNIDDDWGDDDNGWGDDDDEDEDDDDDDWGDDEDEDDEW